MTGPSRPPPAAGRACSATPPTRCRACARGRRSPTRSARCPAAARPGHAGAGLPRAALARRGRGGAAPPGAARRRRRTVDALLLTALALLWPRGRRRRYAEHTLVDQAVAAARARAPRSAGFVNAVLRRFLREREALVAAALADPLARFNHPGLVDRAPARATGPSAGRRSLDADNAPSADDPARQRAPRHAPAAYVAAPRRAPASTRARRSAGMRSSLGAGRCRCAQLPGFADGRGLGAGRRRAQRAAPLLLARGLLAAGARVLDACAAPGGKTRAPARAGRPRPARARPRRGRAWPASTRRWPASACAPRTLAADAADPARWWDGRPFDAILLDAPCSASGIVRRHPDVRWLRRAGRHRRAGARRRPRCSTRSWPLLAPGGRLLYCTCSVFKAEGQEQIDAFLQRHGPASARLEPAFARAPAAAARQ